jgi:hypothetical protein
MTKPPAPKQRRSPEKQHYWLQIDFSIRADTLEAAIKRAAMLFRKAYRTKLREGLVYMGAHSATIRGALRAPRTMHPTVMVKKDLPLQPGVDLATLDAEREARIAAKAARKVKEWAKTQPPGTFVQSESNAAPVVVLPAPTDEVVVKNLKQKRKLVKKGGLSLAALMGEDE